MRPQPAARTTRVSGPSRGESDRGVAPANGCYAEGRTMANHYPVFSEQGDHVQAELEARLAATRALTRDELDSTCEIVAATYQKALQLRYVIEQLVATPAEQRADLAEGLEALDHLLDSLASFHATTRDKLYYAAQRVRAG